MSGGARLDRGRAGEMRARHTLEAAGLLTLSANWRSREGELDLVMQDGSTLVFVEVRARAGGNLVPAAASVDVRKQRQVIRVARRWLQQHRGYAALPARFDVVAIDGDADPQWIRHAFTTDR